jgi:hypothetical protein
MQMRTNCNSRLLANFILAFWLFSGPFVEISATSGSTAPDSVAGNSITFQISTGTFPFANVGSYRFIPSIVETSYSMIPISGTPASIGTYSYNKIAINASKLDVKDAQLGPSTLYLTFTDSSSGVYSIQHSLVASGWQSGSFTLDRYSSPNGIAGRVFIIEVTAGEVPLVSAGSYRILTSPDGTYSISGSSGLPSNAGSYSYDKNSLSTGRISLSDPSGGSFILDLGYDLVFPDASRPRQGTAFLRAKNGFGVQTGTFRDGSPPVITSLQARPWPLATRLCSKLRLREVRKCWVFGEGMG